MLEAWLAQAQARRLLIARHQHPGIHIRIGRDREREESGRVAACERNTGKLSRHITTGTGVHRDTDRPREDSGAGRACDTVEMPP